MAKLADLLPFPAASPAAIPDAAERERALDTTCSFLVEAPAGSGKTGLLIQRFLKLLAGDDVNDPGQVLAITFTRKATAEMRERILKQLALAAREAPAVATAEMRERILKQLALAAGEAPAVATAEMRERILKQLALAAGEAGDTASGGPAGTFEGITRDLAHAVLERDRQLGWNLLDQPARLNIRTIDAVCSEIARSLPVLAGATAGLAPAEDARPLYAEAARRTLRALGAAETGADPALDHAIRHLLRHRDGSIVDLERLLAEMLATREQWADLIPKGNVLLDDVLLDDTTLDATVRPQLDELLDQAICRSLTALSRLIAPSHLERLAELAATLAHVEGYKDKPNPVALCAALRLPPQPVTAHLDHWRALAHLVTTRAKGWRVAFNNNHLQLLLTKDHKRLLQELVAELRDNQPLCAAFCALDGLPPARYPEEQWLVARSLLRLLAHLLPQLEDVFIERGQCDFAQASLLARAALRNRAATDDLAAAAGTRLRHLLVDELQDTSSAQYELIQLLTQGWGPAGETVFLVGDPRQSIYAFRQARVERFVTTMHSGRLGPGAMPIEILHLTANFRSRPRLVADCNDDFLRVFPPEAGPSQAQAMPFRAATAIRESAPTRGRQWHLALLAPERDQEARTRSRARQQRLEADATARLVARWRKQSLQPTTVAVLGRTRAELLPIIAAFKRFSIPFRAINIDPLDQRPEILDLLALTRAVLHPADRTAWLALLRSPWCGLKLADLHTLAGGDLPEWSERTVADAIEQRANLISADGQARVTPFWTILRQALGRRAYATLAQTVAAAWRGFGTARFASAEVLANCERFFALLDELEQAPAAGRFDTSLLTARLGRLYAAASTAPDAVDVLTMHAAKGLEWDLVVVPALERKAQVPRGRLLDWMELDPEQAVDPAGPADRNVARGIFAPIRGKGDPAQQLNRWMSSVQAAREAAERKRLFYVACTRAREELHLFASPASTARGAIDKAPTSLLAAAWPAAEQRFAGLVASPSAGTLLQISLPYVIETLAAGPESDPETSPDAGLQDPPAPPPPLIERIPLPGASALPSIAAGTGLPAAIPRPEGSFAARALGNTLHLFLEQLARRAETMPLAQLAAELPGWSPRVATTLANAGLAPGEVPAAAAQVLKSLSLTLADPAGRWLLEPHPKAASELAVVVPDDAAGFATLRIDRTFLAGARPEVPGDDHLWIVDFKTSTHGTGDLDAWLERQRLIYSSQLERYARAFVPRSNPHQEVRLALYFPRLARLIWWPLSVPAASASPAHPAS